MCKLFYSRQESFSVSSLLCLNLFATSCAVILYSKRLFFFYKKCFICWAICFLSTKRGYINSQNTTIRSAENSRLMYEIPSNSSKFGVRCSLSRKQIVRPSFFEEAIYAEICWPSSLFYWKTMNGTDGFSKMDRSANRTAFLQNFFGDRIIGLGFGHHDHQTFRYMTSFCVDFLKKQFTAIKK